MSDLTLIRTLISDPISYAAATAPGDGNITEFRYPYAPIYTGTCKVRVDGFLKTVGVDYTVDESLGLITLNVAPSAMSVVTVSAQTTMLSDTQINEVLGQYVDDDEPVKLAAADCLDIIASSEALINKKIKILDLQTDGSAVSDALHKHAETLRKQVFDANFNESAFDIAEEVNDMFGYREKILKDRMRES